jgi:hypothetical protein
VKEIAMKFLSYFSLVLLLMLISFPVSSDAFSRRSSHSEVAQPATTSLRTSQTNTSQTNITQANGLNASSQAVPEPPVLWLMSLGVGLLVLGAMFRQVCRSQKSVR